MQLAPGAIVDRYEVIGVLGRGGMGLVLRVRHRQLGTEHALKILRVGSAATTERLLREGRLQGALEHPGIVRVTDLVDVDGEPGLVLELVRGRSLADRLSEGKLLRDELETLALALMEALAAAHDAGLVHRDLKPANVLLPDVGGAARAKIADFGLAKALEEAGGDTVTGAAMGTPAYMAPEQLHDATRVDARADVFALGALLYEAASGRRAFRGATTAEILGRAARGQFLPLRAVDPSLPVAWAAAIGAALQPDPAARPADARALRRLWSGAAPAPAEPAAATFPPSALELDQPVTGHPDFEVLVDGGPGAAEHLERCAACRAELRLYLDAFGPTPGSSASGTVFAAPAPAPTWRPAAVGAALAALAVPVVASAVLGGPQGVRVIGPVFLVLWVVSLAPGAAIGEVYRRVRAGAPPRALAVFGPAAAVSVVGAFAAMAALQRVERAVAAAPAADLPSRILDGGAASLSVFWCGDLICALALGAGMVALAAARRTGPDAAPLDLAVPAFAGAIGLVLWGVEAITSPADPVGALSFVVLLFGATALGAVPGHGRDAATLRVTAAIGLVNLASWAPFSMRAELARRALARAAGAGAEAGGEAARALAGAWTLEDPWRGAAWIAAAAVVGALAVWRTQPAARASVRWRSAATDLAALVGLVWASAFYLGLQAAPVCGSVVGAWESATLALEVPGLHVREAPGEGLVVQPGASEPLAPGERVVAVLGREVEDAAGARATLAACRCPSACADVQRCLDPGAAVPITVSRGGRLATVELTLGPTPEP